MPQRLRRYGLHIVNKFVADTCNQEIVSLNPGQAYNAYHLPTGC